MLYMIGWSSTKSHEKCFAKLVEKEVGNVCMQVRVQLSSYGVVHLKLLLKQQAEKNVLGAQHILCW